MVGRAVGMFVVRDENDMHEKDMHEKALCVPARDPRYAEIDASRRRPASRAAVRTAALQGRTAPEPGGVRRLR